MRPIPLLFLVPLVAACATPVARPAETPAPASAAQPPAEALDAIRMSDLRRDLYTLASDAMRGREAGTLDELRASVWLADQARAAGLEPAGDDGSYFQFWPMRRQRVADASHVEIGGSALALGADWAPWTRVNASLDLPVVWVGDASGDSLARLDLRGKAVAATLLPPSRVPPREVSLRAFRWALGALAERAAALQARGAAAVLLVSDPVADSAWRFLGASLMRGRYNVDTTGAGAVQPGVPVLWVRGALRDQLARAGGDGARLTGQLVVESFDYPSVNVVARVPGTDASVSGEYVLFSGHQDHDGVRFPIDGDSIWNGADDNASVSVALLAIGRAFVAHPGRRSALFVWHGAEERGLLGSRWFVAHPTVPRDSIVAVLNGDMMGRNAPDSAGLLGVTPPHRNSPELVAMALAADSVVGRFHIDSTWDRPSHPEGWYFRSDHLPYARAGIPAIFFTSLLHPDYHTPRDEADRIDYSKLSRMTRWMYATGWLVANAPRRPAVEPGFKLER